ncbi:aminoglycoside 6-adenylyltransferase [Chitinophaga solisilvae]|uniref:aminoglycoside 6-adenylyltransferase n=1 Tax=Chitinophaga solisilvae TaxID=1233460 RepID=UPI00136D3E3C|nr:aminoglycoside 6-adenylyltransferase [Chitinophaga solisilvae]
MTSRSEYQMMQLIMDTATADTRIRAVLLNGSRANPRVTPDIFRDYDIICVVTALAPFLADHSWIDVFGERMILQMPEAMELYPPELDGAFSYLMQFMDGNRIDLTLVPADRLEDFLEDSLCKVMLDKDHLPALADLAPSGDSSYHVNPPAAQEFSDCCNEFLYTATGLAKGIWRKQTVLVKQLFYTVTQGALIQMLDWHIGCRHNFSVNAGKYGKFYPQLLEPELYAALLSTYRTAETGETWEALFTAMDLFHKAAQAVAGHAGFTYPEEEHRKITAYLKHVQQLPEDAKQIYL